MAALPYMPLYVADYLADTAHLSAAAHGAYLLLIMNYWQRGDVLPSEDRKLARIARMTDEEWASVRDDVADFFIDEGDGTWRHGRIEAELAKVRARPPQREWVELRRQVFERDNYTCSYCGKRGGDLECDHIVSAFRGGPANLENLTTSCRECNRSKGAKTFEEWFA